MRLVIILAVLFALSGCTSGSKKPENHLDKLDWQKQLAEAQKNNDYGSCQDVVIAAYLDKNLSVLDKAADICWPMAKNDPGVRSAMAFMDVKTKEDYIKLVGATMNKTLGPDKQK
jgi:hypothetical protein